MSTLSPQDMQDPSVQKALFVALLNNSRLSHSKAVDVLEAALDINGVTPKERKDLTTLINKATGLQERTTKLYKLFLREADRTVGKTKTIHINSDASREVCKFLKKRGKGKFPKYDRDEIGVGLLMRLSNPGLINQGTASLCGPSSMLYGLAKDKPADYIKFAIDLFETGCGRLGNLEIKPCKACRDYLPPRGDIAPVDWMTAASIRDSENWFFSYDEVTDQFAGITLPGDVTRWMKRAGYSHVVNRTSKFRHKWSDNIDEANHYFAKGYRVCLFVNLKMLDEEQQTEDAWTPDHWVVLTAKIKRRRGNIKTEFFTWGDGKFEVPQGGTLSEKDFLENYFGYVAAKP